MVAREYMADFLLLTGCKKVDSGANVAVYVSDSDEVFADSRDINHSRVASPVQVFLDCMQLNRREKNGRGGVFEGDLEMRITVRNLSNDSSCY